MKLLIHPPVDLDRLETIRRAAGEMIVVNARDAQQALLDIVGADAFFGKLTPELLTAAKQLRWVQSPTASLEHYLFPQLMEHPSTLTNMRGLYSDIIADHVFGFILCFARNFHIYIRQQSAGRWAPVGGESARPDFVQGPGTVSAIDRAHPHLAGQTLGIVGLGAIGQEIAHRAGAFAMRVVAVDPVVKQPPEGVSRLWGVDELGALLAESDFVVIAAPHTPTTEKMFRRPQFEAMRPTAHLINIGRGAIVDLSELHAALVAGEIAGAGLDVVEQEPLEPEHPLWRLPNVIITPHVAGMSTPVAERHLAVLVDNVRRFTRGEPLMNVVDKARWF